MSFNRQRFVERDTRHQSGEQSEFVQIIQTLNKLFGKVNNLTVVVSDLQEQIGDLRANQKDSCFQSPSGNNISVGAKAAHMTEEDQLDFDWQNTPLSKTNQDLLHDEDYFLTIISKYSFLTDFR